MIPQRAIDLILVSEGVDQPSKWPGGESGITVGYGYDLGYEKNFASDWEGLIPSGHIERLKVALGRTGLEAKQLAQRFLDIKIQPGAAAKVFITKTLPHYEEETYRAFPKIGLLPDLIFGALVSLVFNRGSGMTGPRRLEMRAIREAILAYSRNDISLATCGRAIAEQLRAMKRLWSGKGMNGLLVRREAEAKLVESAVEGN